MSNVAVITKTLYIANSLMKSTVLAYGGFLLGKTRLVAEIELRYQMDIEIRVIEWE